MWRKKVCYCMTDRDDEGLPPEAQAVLDRFLEDHHRVFEALARDSPISNTNTKKRNKSQ